MHPRDPGQQRLGATASLMLNLKRVSTLGQPPPPPVAPSVPGDLGPCTDSTQARHIKI